MVRDGRKGVGERGREPICASACEYLDMMLPRIYILFQKEYLQGVIETVGFRGLYPKDMWEWMNEIGEGFGEVREGLVSWRERSGYVRAIGNIPQRAGG